MKKVINASYLDYLFLFGKSRSRYSDLSVKSAICSGGNLYIMFEEEQPAGYVCAAEEGSRTEIIYAMTVPEKRNSGIFTALLQYTIKHSAFPVKIGISEENQAFDIILHICRKLGFDVQSSCIIFRGKSEDFYHWEEYMAKTGTRFCSMLLRQGYRCMSFAEADRDCIDKLYHSAGNEFCNRLDIRPFFENQNKLLDKDMSFLSMKGNEIAAYTLVRRPDRISAVFEHISAAQNYIGSGAILLPFSKSMEMFQKFGCKRCAYAMYEQNQSANAFRKKILEKVTSSQKRSYHFIYRKEENYIN